MKPVKKDKTFFKNYGLTVVWLDDLNEIIALLDGAQIDISTDDYQFASVEEAQQHFGPRPIHSLKISSTKPSAQIDFSPRQTQTFVYSSPTSLQLFHELDDILRKCERKPRTLYTYWIIFLLSQIPFALSWVWADPKIVEVPILLAVQVLMMVWVLWVGFLKMRRHSVIILRRRHEVSSFFARNKDTLLIALMSALIGGLVTLGFGRVKDIVFPSAPVVSGPSSEPK